MWDWINNNSNELKTVGTLVGGIGTGYGAYMNAKAIDEANKINKTLLNRQISKEDKAQQEMEEGFKLSTLGSSTTDDSKLTL